MADAVSPRGTTINLFDYWDMDAHTSGNDYANGEDFGGLINKDHALKFSAGGIGGSGNINAYTGGPGPNTGIVAQTLGDDGYPVLTTGKTAVLDRDGATQRTQAESLSYLFDVTQDVDGRAAYGDVGNLLQIDDDGYYYYDSTRNFASFNKDSNAFDLYTSPGVSATGTKDDGGNNRYGQFFPFNTGEQVFTEAADGTLAQAQASRCYDPAAGWGAMGVNTKCTVMNHYFGVSMTTRFVQSDGGRLDDDTPVTYEFSGDDDVWVYIDGVLVGDLGGIHEAASLQIDFSTGRISVNGTTQRQTLGQKLRSAGVTSGVSGSTLTDGSYHTLKFFYLERGNVDSNMSLKYNLAYVPESSVVKVDQNGDPVNGAQFELYATGDENAAEDERYVVADNAQPIASGVTKNVGGEDGILELVDVNDPTQLLSFEEQYTTNRTMYYVLKEVGVPDGYRKAQDDMMQLKYLLPSDEYSTGAVISDPGPADTDSPVWQTGALALSSENVQAPDSLSYTDADGQPRTISADDAYATGTLFAVIFRNTAGSSAADANWVGVTGDQISGWSYTSDDGILGAIEAYRTTPMRFVPSSSGAYSVDIASLPGDVQTYYHMLPDANKGDAKYAVGFYYSTASDAASMNDRNTYLLTDQGFGRNFGVRLYVPDIKNTLFVQKIDESGHSLGGAQLSLYRLDGNETSRSCTDLSFDGRQAYDTVTTAAEAGDDAELSINGTASFPSAGHVLAAGAYCLVEESAPEGYAVSRDASKVIVNEYGVFADAGEADDDITVARGAGWLVSTVSSFGMDAALDNTLTWVKSAPVSVSFGADGTMVDVNPTTALASRVESGEIVSEQTATGDPLRLRYGAGDTEAALNHGYGPRAAGGNTLFVFDTGYGVLSTTQDEADQPDPRADRTELGDQRLSNVVAGTVMVRFTNHSLSASTQLSVDKQVVGADWNAGDDPDRHFSFDLTLTAADPATNAVTYTDADGEHALAVGGAAAAAATSGTIADGDTQRVSWPTLTFPTTNGTYEFRISESTADPAAGWRYDTTGLNALNDGTGYRVRVVVDCGSPDGCTATTTYGDDDGTPPTFVNAFEQVSSLPLAGGNSARDWLLFGGFLGTLALLACAGYTIWRKRQLA